MGDVKSPSGLKPTTTTTTTTTTATTTPSGGSGSGGGATVDAFFSVVRDGNVDKLRQFLRDTKFDVNTRDAVRNIPYHTIPYSFNNVADI